MVVARVGRTIEHAQVNWYDSEALAKKEERVKNKVEKMLKTFGGVVIICGSAGED